MWFWLYRIKVIDQNNMKERICTGLTVGSTIVQAVEKLDDYYGVDIVDILALRAITEVVFPFEEAMEEPAFNFTIVEKEQEESDLE